MKYILYLGLVLGFVAGILFGLATGLFKSSNAAPIELSAAQVRQIVAVNRDINRRFAHFDGRGHGQCGWLAQLKAWALARAGIPESAMEFRDFAAPLGWSDPYHRLLRVSARVNGRPWSVDLDMNQPEPFDPSAERAMGYRPLGYLVGQGPSTPGRLGAQP